LVLLIVRRKTIQYFNRVTAQMAVQEPQWSPEVPILGGWRSQKIQWFCYRSVVKKAIQVMDLMVPRKKTHGITRVQKSTPFF
jgi:hypothetical protein